MLNIDDVAAMFGVTRQTIRNYMDKGLPFYKMPGDHGALKFKEEEVIEWLKTRKVQ